MKNLPILMEKNTLLQILILTTFLSCEKFKTKIETFDKANSDSIQNVQIEKSKTGLSDKNIYTKYEYTDSNGKSITIQNGFPKGGTKYIDSKGNSYNYAVFWTRIINETDHPIELEMNIPADSFEIPNLVGQYYQVLIPADTATIQKLPLFNYGLTDVESFLSKNIQKSSSLKRTISPKEADGFYAVILSLTEGAHGTLRTGLRIKGEHLFYQIVNNQSGKIVKKEVQVGHINLKDLKLIIKTD